MTVEPIRCKLTTNDVAILETILDRLPDAGAPLAALLRAKLKHADLYLSGTIPPDVVTINSRVTYWMDGHDPYTVVIVQAELLPEGVPHALSIHDPLGLALLGLSQGDTIAIATESGWPRTVVIERVISQPEGETTSRVISFPVRKPPIQAHHYDGDDPGPSAA